MKILRLEQVDWMKHSDFPSHGRDWEARRNADFDIRPRQARPTDYPINNDNSPMQGANFNVSGVAGDRAYPPRQPPMPPAMWTRTIQAVALYLAERMKRRLATLFD